jgi:hypothetical protein
MRAAVTTTLIKCRAIDRKMNIASYAAPRGEHMPLIYTQTPEGRPINLNTAIAEVHVLIWKSF